MSRVLGIDHGGRRIGLAVGDLDSGFAFERPALVSRSRQADVGAIVALARAEGTRLVVLGLPLAGDGGEGEQAARVRSFGAALEGADLDVVYADERFSTTEATRQLAEAGRQPPRRTGEIDSAAARLILQQFLDERAAAARGPQEQQ